MALVPPGDAFAVMNAVGLVAFAVVVGVGFWAAVRLGVAPGSVVLPCAPRLRAPGARPALRLATV